MYIVQFRTIKESGRYGKWNIVKDFEYKQEAFNIMGYLIKSLNFDASQYRVVELFIVQKPKYREIPHPKVS
ncbi:MAG: hypothetical protein FWH17_10540 [Oscillospiraceae bacterium]|nr:hypothetical protein [Oscillospiraceae bacterium]